MDIEQYLILLKGEDKTKQVKSYKIKGGGYFSVTFDDYNVYNYNIQNVVALRNPVEIDCTKCVIYKGNQPLSNIRKLLIFKPYCRIIYNNNYTEVLNLNDIEIKESALNDPKSKICIDYFKQAADLISVKDEQDRSFLNKQYDKMTFIHNESILAKYISNSSKFNRSKVGQVLFPFGFNISQKRATELAFQNQLSVVEGPPGTGKTQTILNIIANAIIENKTVAVVSNNNSATANVVEKLMKYDLDFICAYLGSSENKEKFFKNQSGEYPNFKEWEKPGGLSDVTKLQRELEGMLISKNLLAKVTQDIHNLNTEFKYFKEYYSKVAVETSLTKKFERMKSNKILDLIIELKSLINKNKMSLLLKWKIILAHGYGTFKEINKDVGNVITTLQYYYYKNKLSELEKLQKGLNDQLNDYNFKDKMKEYTELSLKYFKYHLAKRYKKQMTRKIYYSSVIRNDFEKFIIEYPVILSTTHSLRNSVQENYQFDYLIIDEASQVDLVSGGLALSCAKNAIIVGDMKQLPNVIPTNKVEQLNKLFNSYRLNGAYNVAEHSLLSSILKLYPEVPKTLLKEHYRCHPQIINYCNQKFYNNELIILTEEDKDYSPLTLYTTVEGNHARSTYNQRQIDVITKEILPALSNVDQPQSVGIISPYRKHAEELQRVIKDPNIEADTVHKFQGREKDVIILSTVANDVNDFIDDPNLINVAVSRAVKQLTVVVAKDFENKKGTNIGDLIRYIKYNNFDVIESQVYSAFDLLYSSYSGKLLKMYKDVKKVSDYQSENLMNKILDNVLQREEFRSLGKIMHQPLKMLIKETSKLDEEEYKYAMNILTHTDFLIYSKVDKSPLLVIEVDGYAFHDQNPVQLKRDKLKDKILEKYNIPILRLKTNGSGEEERVVDKLNLILS